MAYSDLAYNEPHEIINGKVYPMSNRRYNHAVISSNISNIFERYLDGKRCEAFNQFNVFFDEDNHYVPDEVIICNPDIVEEDAIHGTPDLVVEILSKSTAIKDRMDKFVIYEKFGVKEYWIVDPFIKSVEVYLLKDGKLQRSDIYQYYTDEEYNELTKLQKADAKFEIKVSLYDDFVVQLKDIFKRVK
ncbi:MAG: Uma2 family endonuclease [Selenomonadaceae bacterium]|nr:Uma2 family endonuclease [Selenomonadaceae bacterium]